MLIVPIPTELTDLGFHEGEHFVGWREEKEIRDLVDHYLRNEVKRRQIARTGQELVLKEHTFRRRREELVSALAQHGDQFFAPARKWPLERVHLTYLEYYYKHLVFCALLPEFGNLSRTGRGAALKGAPMVMKALRHGFMRILR